MAQGCLYKALIFLGNALFEWYLIHKERINLLVRYGLYKGNVTLEIWGVLIEVPLGPLTVKPMYQPASVVANTLCCKLSCSPCRQRRYRKCAARDS